MRFRYGTTPVPAPLPMQPQILKCAILGTEFLAVSNQVEPLGPQPTFAAGTPVRTETGYRNIEHLARGQLVMTSQGRLVPVLHKIARRVPARGRFAPHRLRAPYLELKCDIIVAADQRIEIRGSDVEYSFGTEAVFVGARSLVNGHAAFRQTARPFATYYQVVLASHDCIDVAGASLESLYIGRIRRRPGQLRRTLLSAIDRESLPEHRGIKHAALRPFDAIALLDQIAA